ncbi:ribosomal protein L7/L12 [candidate division KSB1 bacterium]|nr:ribosomal protein L7/L12 [candidate division KSB1 bacterium]
MDEQLTGELKQQLLSALRTGKKIEAIKIYREATGKGLKESKEAVEAFIDEVKVQYPDMAAKLKPGCSTSILLTMLFIALWVVSNVVL